MAHVLEHLRSDQIRLIAADPLTDEGRSLLERISGADRPYRDLDEMFADSPDPYGEDLQAAFDAEQQRDEEREPELLSLASEDESSGHWITLDGTHLFIKGGEVAKGPPELTGKKLSEAHEWHAKQRDREAKTSHAQAKYEAKKGNTEEAAHHAALAKIHENKAAELRKVAAKQSAKVAPAESKPKPQKNPESSSEIDRYNAAMDKLDNGKPLDANELGKLRESISSPSPEMAQHLNKYAGGLDNSSDRGISRIYDRINSLQARAVGKLPKSGDIQSDMRRAIEHLGGKGTRQRIADFRTALSGYSRQEQDSALMDAAMSGNAVLYEDQQAPVNLPPEDTAAAWHTPSGTPRHIIYWTGKGGASKPNRE